MKIAIKQLVQAGAVATGLVFGLMSAPVAETKVSFIPSSDLNVVDPIWSTAAISMAHGYLVYDTLFAEDANGVARAQMIQDHSVSADRLSYRFTLRDGLAWHDGTPVTSEDCIASIRRWAARDSAGRILLQRTKELRAIDGKTFEFVLSEPFGALVDLLGKSAPIVPFMMPKRVAETDPAKQISETIGSGPFTFSRSEWAPGSKVVYRRNANYMPRSEPASGRAGGKVVKVDIVEWTILRDHQTALSAMIAGEADIWESPPTDHLSVLERSRGVQLVVTNPTGWTGAIIPNHRHPPFDNPKAREGIAWLIHQETFLQAIVGNPRYYATCPSLFTCDTPMSTNIGSEAIVGTDRERARRLFAESGWNFSQPIVLLNPSDDREMNAATLVMAQMLKSIGLTVDVQAMDWATLTRRRASTAAPSQGGWHIFATYGSGITRADPFFSVVYSAACDKGWFSGACDQTLEQLRAKWPVADGLAAKKAIAEQYQRRAYEIYSPWLPIGQWSQPIAARTTIRDIVPAGAVVVFWNLQKQAGR